MASNRKTGNRFEAELCDLLAEKGWWSHDMAQNQTGQPADVIAVKDDVAILIDCKVCENDTFPLSRVESNQEGAMTLWAERGNTYSGFALKLSDGSIYLVPYDSIVTLELKGVKTLSQSMIRNYNTFVEWLQTVEWDSYGADWHES